MSVHLVSWGSIELLHNVVRTLTMLHEEHHRKFPVVRYRAKVKLHGSNCAVQVHADGVLAQSRTTMLTPQADYKGFADVGARARVVLPVAAAGHGRVRRVVRSRRREGDGDLGGRQQGVRRVRHTRQRAGDLRARGAAGALARGRRAAGPVRVAVGGRRRSSSTTARPRSSPRWRRRSASASRRSSARTRGS